MIDNDRYEDALTEEENVSEDDEFFSPDTRTFSSALVRDVRLGSARLGLAPKGGAQ